MKKSLKLILAMGLALGVVLTANGCGGSKDSGSAGDKKTTKAKKINPVSREDGSGTRGAFVELFGIEEKGADGKKVDKTDPSIEITNSTSVVMQTVMDNKSAIGYISLGSLNDDLKALKIDGVDATVANIQNGTYKIARPFNIVTKDTQSDVVKDFISFILSKQGQEIVETNKYIPIAEAKKNEYKAGNVSGKLSVSGSSSVTPVMQKLAEAYKKVSPKVEVDVAQSDSTTGVNSMLDGAADIGMASREIKDSEIKKGAKPTVIALDGIALVVNKSNSVEGASKDTIKKIYTKQITKWDEVK